MNKRLLNIVFLLFLIVPIFAYFSINNYYDYYDKLRQTYECYPIESCQVDIDDDLIVDSIKLTNNSQNIEVFLNREKREAEQVLSIKYQFTDFTFRTYAAFLIEENRRKFVIYDTQNEHQFFAWNGQKFVPSHIPSNLEIDIRESFKIQDETGGFYIKMFFETFSIPLLITYYLLFCVLFIFQFRKQNNLLK